MALTVVIEAAKVLPTAPGRPHCPVEEHEPLGALVEVQLLLDRGDDHAVGGGFRAAAPAATADAADGGGAAAVVAAGVDADGDGHEHDDDEDSRPDAEEGEHPRVELGDLLQLVI